MAEDEGTLIKRLEAAEKRIAELEAKQDAHKLTAKEAAEALALARRVAKMWGVD